MPCNNSAIVKKDLANEYEKEAKSLTTYISWLKQFYAKEILFCDPDVCHRIEILDEMKQDLICTGHVLSKRCEVNYGEIHKI